MEGLDGPGAPGRSGLPGVRRGERRDRGRQAEGAGGALQPEAEGDRGAEQGDLPPPGWSGQQLGSLPVPFPPPPSVRSIVRGETLRNTEISGAQQLPDKPLGKTTRMQSEFKFRVFVITEFR